MALVKFRRNWFSPSAARYKVSDGVQEVPEHELKELPSDAVIVSQKEKPVSLVSTDETKKK